MSARYANHREDAQECDVNARMKRAQAKALRDAALAIESSQEAHPLTTRTFPGMYALRLPFMALEDDLGGGDDPLDPAFIEQPGDREPEAGVQRPQRKRLPPMR